MERYWDCSLCRIEDKGNAFRCRICYGKLRGRDRLLREVSEVRRTGPVSGMLSSLAPGLGQFCAGRWATGATLAILVPLTVGLIAAVWHGPSYGHLFVGAAAAFIAAVARLDARLGPSVASAPCQGACPAQIDVPDYLQLILDREYDQGYSLIRTRIPLVGTIGRICPHPCEIRCVRGIDGEPISINGCKRFLADRHRETAKPTGRETPRRVALPGGEKTSVGVVGAGPAGIACAYYLTVLGASVTVYEAEEIPGGRLATTIPDFRLPLRILAQEIEDLRNQGVLFSVGSLVGPGGTSVEELIREHRALFLAVGAQRSLTCRLSGAPGVLDFQSVLRSAKFGQTVEIGRKVAVVGGGNAAVDVCRSALRLGAEEVHLVYRRSRDEMPARDEDVEECLKEGVKFHFLTDPVEAVSDDGRLKAVILQVMRLGAPDASGRPAAEPVEGALRSLAVDCLIPALGQAVGGGVLDDPYLRNLRRETDGRIWVNPRTQATSVRDIYAGGDAVTGPGTAVQALAQGRRGAIGLWGDVASDSRKGVLPLTDRRLRKPFPGHRETPDEKVRETMPRHSARTRVDHFREVEEGFREGPARREAGRCLQCHREL